MNINERSLILAAENKWKMWNQVRMYSFFQKMMKKTCIFPMLQNLDAQYGKLRILISSFDFPEY